MKRKTKKTLVRAVAVVLGFVLVVGAVSFIGKKTNGFADDITLDALTQRDLNKDNLYTVDALTIETYDAGTGIVIEKENDGVLVLDGKLGGETAADIKVGSIDLKKGTYSLTTGANGKGSGVGQYSTYMYLTADNGTTKLAFDFGGTATDGVFEIATADSYDIYIHVEPDVDFNDKHFYPTIIEGDETGAFYAD